MIALKSVKDNIIQEESIMANVKHIVSEEFDAFLDEKNLALVDFWATWCGPCRMVAPVIEQIAEEYANSVNVGKVDVDDQGALAMQFGVMSIPTVVLFKNGKEVDRRVGAMPADEYRKMIDAQL